MQAITPALEAILKDKFQAGAAGFRGRIEVDLVEGSPLTCALSIGATSETHGGNTPTTNPAPISVDFTPTGAGILLAFLQGTTYATPGASDITNLDAPYTTLHNEDVYSKSTYVIGVLEVDDTSGVCTAAAEFDYGFKGDGAVGAQVFLPTSTTAPTQLKALAHAFDSAPTTGNMVLAFVHSEGVIYADPSMWKTFVNTTYAWADHKTTVGIFGHCVEDGEPNQYGYGAASVPNGFPIVPSGGYSTSYSQVLMEWPITGTAGVEGVPISFQPKRISLDKSLRMTADQATIEIANEDLPYGWGPGSPSFVTNSRVRTFQWYGHPDNEVQTFTGIVDARTDTRDVLTTSLACRDMMALLIDQTFGATAPQGAEETDAVRTAANGVYLSMEIHAIVADILDRAGWPTADRAITDTSYVLDEYIIPDGTSWAEAIIGEAVLTGLVGFDAWADEAGVFHFAPSLLEDSLTDPGTPAYTFESGVDIVSLQDMTDQYDLRTRVKVRGPLTTTTLTDTWREIWRTSKFAHPVGLWYDSTDSANIRVLDRGTKRLYKMRQSDRVVLSSTYLGTVIPYPLGLSGDPSDATIYYVLNGPWLWGSGAASSIKVVRKADNVVLDTYALDTDHWSAVKCSGAYLYTTNLSDERVYRWDKTDGSAVDDFRHTYQTVAQSNPSGIMIDGTTISVFWSNGGTTARFLQCAEAAPGTVTKVVKTAGTSLHGGEMDTTTHTECWGDDDGAGLVAKFTLVEAVDQTDEVYAEVVDTALEDELGALAQMESRTHDTHSGDADHPFEIRRDTVDVTIVTSLAQATDTAMRRLDRLSQRRRVLDVGIVGNPALQKSDLVSIIDPVTGIDSEWLIDTYRTEMSADGTYLGTLALLPVTVPDDDVTDDGDATE